MKENPDGLGTTPKRQRRSATGLRLDPDLHARLTQAAADRDLSVNFLVNRAVERFLDRLIPVEEMKWTRD